MYVCISLSIFKEVVCYLCIRPNGLWKNHLAGIAVKNGQSYSFVPLVSLYGAKRKNFPSAFYMCHV
jgi:hypothetical protein